MPANRKHAHLDLRQDATALRPCVRMSSDCRAPIPKIRKTYLHAKFSVSNNGPDPRQPLFYYMAYVLRIVKRFLKKIVRAARKIRLTKNRPAWYNVPTAGAENAREWVAPIGSA